MASSWLSLSPSLSLPLLGLGTGQRPAVASAAHDAHVFFIRSLPLPLPSALSLSLFFDTARRGPRESAPPPRGFAHWGARNGKAQLAGEENHWCANHNTRTLVLDPQPASKAKNQTPHLLALALNYEA